MQGAADLPTAVIGVVGGCLPNVIIRPDIQGQQAVVEGFPLGLIVPDDSVGSVMAAGKRFGVTVFAMIMSFLLSATFQRHLTNMISAFGSVNENPMRGQKAA